MYVVQFYHLNLDLRNTFYGKFELYPLRKAS